MATLDSDEYDTTEATPTRKRKSIVYSKQITLDANNAAVFRGVVKIKVEEGAVVVLGRCLEEWTGSVLCSTVGGGGTGIRIENKGEEKAVVVVEDGDSDGDVRFSLWEENDARAPTTLQYPMEWRSGLESVPVEESGSFLVCGQPNSGKSTFARFLMNRLMQEQGAVVGCIDLDPGQTEFTPPGMMSLQVLESTRLCTFPFSAQAKSIRSYYLGAVSPNVVPERYRQLVMALFSDWEEFQKSLGTEQRLFVVVNTSGWIQGLGQDLLTRLCQKQLCTKVFLLTDQDSDVLSVAMNGLHCLPSFQVFGNAPRNARGKNASLHREKMWIKWMYAVMQQQPPSSTIPSGDSLKALVSQFEAHPPWKVHRNDITLHFLLGTPKSTGSELAKLLNWCIVGLCELPSRAPTSPAACLGLGLVRGVSGEELYLLTDLPASILSRVSLFQVGRLLFPVSCMTSFRHSLPFRSTPSAVASRT